jgi:hypothetical protein
MREYSLNRRELTRGILAGARASVAVSAELLVWTARAHLGGRVAGPLPPIPAIGGPKFFA